MDLAKQIIEARKNKPTVSIRWIKGHGLSEEHNQADKLASATAMPLETGKPEEENEKPRLERRENVESLKLELASLRIENGRLAARIKELATRVSASPVSEIPANVLPAVARSQNGWTADGVLIV